MNAPIALFVYNRPDHTRRVLEKLKKNELASESTLYVFCDGPKESATPEQRAQINEVRKVVASEKWCKKVVLIFEEKNKGTNKSIFDGLTRVIDEHNSVIVVEDDIITSKYFLRYMNEALERYASEEKVMAVSGYWFPVNSGSVQPFFLCTGVGWGWGTWDRAWKKCMRDDQYLIDEIQRNQLVDKFNRDNSYDFFGLLKANQKGLISGWDAEWYASIFLNNGLVLFPPYSFTINIGMDGSGTHFSQATNQFRHSADSLDMLDTSAYQMEFPDSIFPDEIAGKKMNAYLSGITESGFFRRLKEKIRLTLKRKN